MTRVPMPHRRFVASAGVSVMLLSLSSCGSSGGSDMRQPESARTTMAVAAPDFVTVKDLARNSSVYVRGTIGGIISREADDGGLGDASGIAQVPVKFVALEVTQSSDPELVAVGSAVPVIWSDLGPGLQSDQASDLVEGAEVLIFAETLTAADAPGIQTVERFLAPVGGENGVFDVQRGIATARSAMLTGLTTNADKRDGRFRAEVELVTTTAESLVAR